MTDQASCPRCGGALVPVLLRDPSPRGRPLSADPPVAVRCVGCEPELFGPGDAAASG